MPQEATAKTKEAKEATSKRGGNSPRVDPLPENEVDWSVPPPARTNKKFENQWTPGVIALLKKHPGRMGMFMVCFSAGQAYNKRKTIQKYLAPKKGDEPNKVDESKHFEFEVRELVGPVAGEKVWKIWGRYNPPKP